MVDTSLQTTSNFRPEVPISESKTASPNSDHKQFQLCRGRLNSCTTTSGTSSSSSSSSVKQSCPSLLIRVIKYTGGIIAYFYTYFLSSSVMGSSSSSDCGTTTKQQTSTTATTSSESTTTTTTCFTTCDSAIKYTKSIMSIDQSSSSTTTTTSSTTSQLMNQSMTTTTTSCFEQIRILYPALDTLLGETYKPCHLLPNENPASNDGITKIRHTQQLENWDCGVTCVQMVLRWLRDINNDDKGQPFVTKHSTSTSNINSISSQEEMTHKYGKSETLSSQEQIERNWMLNAIGTQSIWTIDLCILLYKILCEYRHQLDFPQTDNDYDVLDRIHASFLFCSSKLGVDESYHGFSYYKSAFQNDAVRVMDRFRLAEELGLSTICISGLRLCHVVDVIARENCVAIVLLDNQMLLHCREVWKERRNSSSKEEEEEEEGFGEEEEDVSSSSSVRIRELQRNSCDAHDDEDNETDVTQTIERVSDREMDKFTNHMYQNWKERLLDTTTTTYSKKTKRQSCIGRETTSENEILLSGTTTSDTIGSSSSSSHHYSGHYVVLCGISYDPDDIAEAEKHFLCDNDNNNNNEGNSYCMVIKNPGSVCSTDFLTPAHFEFAWRANGTDEDIIFISNHLN